MRPATVTPGGLKDNGMACRSRGVSLGSHFVLLSLLLFSDVFEIILLLNIKIIQSMEKSPEESYCPGYEYLCDFKCMIVCKRSKHTMHTVV